MSKLLDQQDQLSSIGAARDFRLMCIGDNNYQTNANVIVLNPDEEDEDNYIHYISSIDVRVDLGTNYHRVYVMWEQKFGDDFKQVDSALLESYPTGYNKMEYRHKELTIYSDKRKIIIRV